jgi:hypothetical protein
VVVSSHGEAERDWGGHGKGPGTGGRIGVAEPKRKIKRPISNAPWFSALSATSEKIMTAASGERLPAFLSRAEQAVERDFPVREFRVGHVLTQTFLILRRHLLPFLLLYGVASLLLNVPVAFTNHDSPVADIAVACGISLALCMMFNVFAGAAVVTAAIDDIRGRPVDMTAALRVALRRFFPVLGTTIAVVALGIIGLALIVPALIVITVLFVAVPACVVEGLGPVQSVRRSVHLTRGYRWRIFALWFATLLTESIVLIALDQATEPLRNIALIMAPQIAWDTVIGAFAVILTAVTYRDLRVAKEGVDTDQIAAVFD